MTAARFHDRYQIRVTLLWLLCGLYLLAPTSAPLALNGLPLDRKGEFLVFLAMTFVAVLAGVQWYLTRIDLLPLAHRDREASRFYISLETVAVMMVLTLLIFKLFFSESNQLTSCIEIPGENDHPCVWLPEGFRLHQPNQISRLEESITFAPDRPWRLSTFNDARVFNVFWGAEGTFERKIQDLRQAHSYPFSATLHLGGPVTSLLQREYVQDEKLSLVVRYTGIVSFSGIGGTAVKFPFSEIEQHQSLEIPAAAIGNLAIVYQNFRCADDKQNSSQCARSLSVSSLPLEAARLDVRVVQPRNGREIPLGYAPLVANGKLRIVLSAFRTLEVLAGIIVALTALARIYRYFSLVPGNANRFTHRARPHLQGIFQIILVAALGALVCRVFYRHVFPIAVLANGVKLTILIPLGAAYIGSFWVILFAKRANQAFSRVVSTLGRGAVIVALSPFLLYIFLTLCSRVPAMNEATLLNPGDDPFAFATDGMGILENGAVRMTQWQYSTFLTRPLFPHFRALGYGLLGGGEVYYSILITTAYACVFGLVISISVLAVPSGANFVTASWRVRFLIGVACTLAYVTLSRMFLAFGASFAGLAFSEGPAWLFGLGSCALLVTLTNSGRPELSLWLIGVLFAASLCFRSQYVMYLPLMVFLCAYLRQDVSWKRLFTCLGLPAFVTGVLLLVNYLRYGPSWTWVRVYLNDNTALMDPLPGEPLLQSAKILFPSFLELLCVLAVLALIVWAWATSGGTKRTLFLLFTYASTMFLLNFIVGGKSHYYPRNLVTSFFLSSCASIALIQNRFGINDGRKFAATLKPADPKQQTIVYTKHLLPQSRSDTGAFYQGSDAVPYLSLEGQEHRLPRLRLRVIEDVRQLILKKFKVWKPQERN